MAQFSKELLDMVTEFMIREIGSEGNRGITYTLLLDGKDDEKIETYKLIEEEARKCGYTNNEVFRSYRLCNGYIFDMDISTVKQITSRMVLYLIENQLMEKRDIELIKTQPDKARKSAMNNLASFARDRYNKGIYQFDVALYNKNISNQIQLHVKDTRGQEKLLIYKAYALRHWDIEEVNASFLIPAKLRIKSIQALEILPNRNGVVFRMELTSAEEYKIDHNR